MLIENFYHIVSTRETGEMAWTINIELNPEHRVYRGHFPGNPVLPGVCTLQIIKECLSEQLNLTYRYDRISSCKYLSAINPLQTSGIELHLTAKPAEGEQLHLAAEGKAGGVEFIKLKATLSANQSSKSE